MGSLEVDDKGCTANREHLILHVIMSQLKGKYIHSYTTCLYSICSWIMNINFPQEKKITIKTSLWNTVQEYPSFFFFFEIPKIQSELGNSMVSFLYLLNWAYWIYEAERKFGNLLVWPLTLHRFHPSWS